MCNTTKKNHNVQDTTTPTHLIPLNATLPIPSMKLYTTTKLPPAGKEYLCFQINGKYSQAAKCFKYMIPTKVIDYILYIEHFSNNALCLKVCYNHHVSNITLRLLVLTNQCATWIILNTNV